MNEKMKYVEKIKSNNERAIRTELLFMPLLVIVPFIVGLSLIFDWYFRGFLENISAFDGELILGIIIIVGNIVFDVPFIKSLIKFNKKK